MNIGIDLGSTNTTISCFDKNGNTLKVLKLSNNAPNNIPSIVCVKKDMGQVSIGDDGIKKLLRQGDRYYVFTAFKMLLTESDPAVWAQYSYDNKHTPEEITKIFLREIFKTFIQNNVLMENEKFENIYICVPDTWETKIIRRGQLGDYISDSIDGKRKLVDILCQLAGEGLPINKNGINVVTEPEAASAYFAYYYYNIVKRPFNGHILLIDYGGGTLDLTLTNVKSNQNGSMEITRCKNGGAGQNHRDENGRLQVGQASIAFQNKLMTYALREAGLLDEKTMPDYDSVEWKAAQTDLEMILKNTNNQEEMKTVFKSFGNNNYSLIKAILNEPPISFPSEEEPSCFYFNGEECYITYQQIYRAYRDVAEGVLADETRKICTYTKDKYKFDPCLREAGNNDNFKLVEVGGFCSFCLVKMQLAEIFGMNTNQTIDKRLSRMPTAERELAISYGAALLAANKITLHRTVKYSIGVLCGDENDMAVYYCMHYNQVIEPNVPTFIMDPHNNTSKMTFGGSISENVTHFVVNDVDDPCTGYIMPIRETFRKELEVVPHVGFWFIGFSFTETDFLTMHIISDKGRKQGEYIIHFRSYSEIFNFNAATKIRYDKNRKRWYKVK